MPQRILGVDLGSFSVKAVLLETGFRGFRVVKAAELCLAAASEDPDGDSLPERQALALTELLADEQLRSDAQVAAFPGEQAAVRFVRLPFSDSRRVDQLMEGELADLIPFDLDAAVHHHQIVERRPVRGAPGSSASLAVAAKEDSVRDFLARIEEAGVDPKFLPLDVLGLYGLYTHFLATDGTRPETPGSPDTEELEAVVDEPQLDPALSLDAPAARPDARLLVDIGHTRTLVLAASSAGIAHARVIRAGGADVTRSIARTYGISFADAEAGKHADGQLCTARHPAVSDEAQQLSDVIGQGLGPLIGELRRTLAAIRHERRVEIRRVDLLGGTARLGNLAHFLAEALGVPVGRAVAVEQVLEGAADPDRAPAFATAIGAALRASGEAPVCPLDLRRGEFAYVGGLQHLRRRAPTMAVSVASLLILLMTYGAVRSRAVAARETEVDREFCRITKQVVGREICEPDVALSVMRQPPSELGTFSLPKVSGYRVMVELSRRVPEDTKIKLTDLNVQGDRAMVEGDADSFDAVDRLVGAYAESPCLEGIEKDRLRKKMVGDGVEFRVKMRVGCQ